MNYLISAILSFMLFNCSVELVETWKNPEIDTYSPSKVLIIGMTSNMEVRAHFENQLKKEFELRGSKAIPSIEFFDLSSRSNEMTEMQMDELENNLLGDGFDTILFTKVIGVDDKIRYKQNYDGFDETYKKFKEEYLMYQDIYYNPEYYEDYKLYHTETSMYCICPNEERRLIWKGFIDIPDPQNLEEIINDYVKIVIFALEEQNLMTPLPSVKSPPEHI